MTARAQFSIGPLASGIEADVFRRWFEEGDKPSIEFARGAVPPRSLAVWQISLEWVQSGLITVTAKKQNGGGYAWIAERISAAAAAARAPVIPAAPEKLTSLGDTIEQAILKVIRHAANFGMPCPSLSDLAKAGELASADAARYQLGKLEAAGKVRVQNDPDGKRRIQILGYGGAVIKSTGWMQTRSGQKDAGQ